MNSRLFVGNLSFQTTEETIQRTFEQIGDVVEVKLMLDRETGRSRGFAFVSMATPEAAQKAIQALDGTDLEGRTLRVNEAEQRRDRGPRGGGGGGFRDRGDRGDGGGRGDRDRGGRGRRDRDRDRDRGDRW